MSGLPIPTPVFGLPRASGGRASAALAAGSRQTMILGLLILAALLIPLIFHGCHGGDVDHEPTVLPVRTQAE